MGGFSTKSEVLASLNEFQGRVKFDFTSGNLDYIGKNMRVKAGDGDGDWTIKKFNWSGTDIDNIQGPLIGSWTNRATLDW